MALPSYYFAHKIHSRRLQGILVKDKLEREIVAMEEEHFPSSPNRPRKRAREELTQGKYCNRYGQQYAAGRPWGA